MHILSLVVATDVNDNPCPTMTQMERFGITRVKIDINSDCGGCPQLKITFHHPALIYAFLQDFLELDRPEQHHDFTVTPSYTHLYRDETIQL